MRRLILIAILVYSTSLVVRATPLQEDTGNCIEKDNSSRPDCPRAIDFLHRLRSSVDKNQRNEVANLVHYPLRVNFPKKKLVRSKAEFLRIYDKIFTRELRCVLDNARDEDIWGNYRGFMIGRGALWWEGTAVTDPDDPDFWKKGKFGLITINGPFAGIDPCPKNDATKH